MIGDSGQCSTPESVVMYGALGESVTKCLSIDPACHSPRPFFLSSGTSTYDVCVADVHVQQYGRLCDEILLQEEEGPEIPK